MIGTTIGGKYTVVRQLGEGGMGAVYEARHTGTGRRVAIKVITGRLDPELIARFELEARAAGAIESEHIAQVLDVGQDDTTGAPFLVMEYLVGEDLERVLGRLGPIPWDLTFRIGVQALLGLERAHASGIVHRDIKPANLFLTERDGGELRVKVLDFGIAKVTADVVAQPVQPQQKGPLTQVGTFVGSPLYMSPEQTRGGALDHRTDIWSLGIVLYQALAGRTPFEHTTTLGDFVATVNTTMAPTVRTYAAWIDPAIAAVVERSLAINPAYRYQSAAEFRAALEAFLPQGTSIRASMLASAASGPVVVTPPPMGVSTPHGATPGPMSVSTPHGAMPMGAAMNAPTQVGGPAWQGPPSGAPVMGAAPVMGGAPVMGAAPIGIPAPPPVARRGKSSGPVIAVALSSLIVGSGLAAAFGLGWIGKKSPEPVTSASAAPSAPPPVDTAAAAAALAALVGAWKTEAGVVYDAVPNGQSVEMRIRDVDDLAAQGYVAGDTHFALRPIPEETGHFRVTARIRPLPPKGMTYDKTRARTTCEHSWRDVSGKQLRAEHQGERLVVKLVKIDPPASAFLRDGTKVIGCNNLADAPAVETEIVLSPATGATAVTPKLPLMPKPDAGAPKPDAGAPPPFTWDGGSPWPPPHVVDAGGPPQPPPSVVDAGAPGDPGGIGRPVGATCQRDGHCVSHNCNNRRCQPNTPGSTCMHGRQCGSGRCQNRMCQ